LLRSEPNVAKEFHQIEWNAEVEDDFRQIVRLAVREDLDRKNDWTTLALVPLDARGKAAMVARQGGVVCGVPAVACALHELNCGVDWNPQISDGDSLQGGQILGVLSGPARGLLTAERILLNVVGRLSGIATGTARFVEAVDGTKARIYDTRKTTPGWRRLEKYAVRCGGGHNHRTGLFDAILIKDNHLALGRSPGNDIPGTFTPAEAVLRARRFLAEFSDRYPGYVGEMIVEVEVDSLAQLEQALPAGPDIVLLDNMDIATLREAVSLRDAAAPIVQLEASGGINLDTVGEIARSGVDRISVGGLTHAAVSLDVGLDWLDGSALPPA